MEGRRQVCWVSETSPRPARSVCLLSSEEDVEKLREDTSEAKGGVSGCLVCVLMLIGDNLWNGEQRILSVR